MVCRVFLACDRLARYSNRTATAGIAPVHLSLAVGDGRDAVPIARVSGGEQVADGWRAAVVQVNQVKMAP